MTARDAADTATTCRGRDAIRTRGSAATEIMELTGIRRDEAAVSPVVGVVLMVAITVSMVGLIGPFVVEAGSLSSAPPRASFEFAYSDADTVTITHVGGDRLDGDALAITGLEESADLSGSTYGVNDRLVNREPVDPEVNRIRVVWRNPSGGSSNVIGSSTVPRG